MTKPDVSDLLSAVVRKHYTPIKNPIGTDGAQMWNGEWWLPTWGCDTLANMLDDMIYAVNRNQKAKSEDDHGERASHKGGQSL